MAGDFVEATDQLNPPTPWAIMKTAY